MGMRICTPHASHLEPHRYLQEAKHYTKKKLVGSEVWVKRPPAARIALLLEGLHHKNVSWHKHLAAEMQA